MSRFSQNRATTLALTGGRVPGGAPPRTARARRAPRAARPARPVSPGTRGRDPRRAHTLEPL
ncbi:hypothetical protein GCM10009551_046910 [Nocardiopsis tropica]